MLMGRGIFDRLRRAMSFIVAVHVPIFGMSPLPLFAGDWPLVLLPIQLAILELVIDPTCSIVFEADPPDPSVMERPPVATSEPLLSRSEVARSVAEGCAVLVASAAVYLWAIRVGEPTALVLVVSVTVLFLVLLLMVPGLRGALDLGTVGWPEVLIPPVAALLALVGFEIAKIGGRFRAGR